VIPADGLLPLIEVYSWRLIFMYAVEDRRKYWTNKTEQRITPCGQCQQEK
jgi:hypothetical protein